MEIEEIRFIFISLTFINEKNYMPISELTTVDLGFGCGNDVYNMVQKTEAPFSNAYIELFVKSLE